MKKRNEEQSAARQQKKSQLKPPHLVEWILNPSWMHASKYGKALTASYGATSAFSSSTEAFNPALGQTHGPSASSNSACNFFCASGWVARKYVIAHDELKKKEDTMNIKKIPPQHTSRGKLVVGMYLDVVSLPAMSCVCASAVSSEWHIRSPSASLPFWSLERRSFLLLGSARRLWTATAEI